MPDTASAAAAPRATAGAYVWLTLIWSGLVVTEQVSAHVLPLTVRQFTENAGIIGLVLAINPAFGFLAQPLAGALSDRLWKRRGRRAVLLACAAPAVAACLWWVPEARVFWHLIVLVVIYQFFQDIAWGATHPLVAGAIPPRRRTLAMGFVVCAGQCVAFLFLRFGMGHLLGLYGEQVLYRTAAVAQVVLVAAAALAVRERTASADERSRPVAGWRDLVRDPVLARFCLLAFLQAYLFASCAGFAVLFATQTVGLTGAQFGAAWGWHALCMLTLAVPVGLAVERLDKSRVLQGAYVVAVVGCGLGWFTHGYAGFVAVSVVFGVCQAVVHVTQRAFFWDHLPGEAVGRLSGVYSICLGLGRSLALGLGGWLVVAAGNNYRVVWLAGAMAAVAAVVLTCGVRDRRFERSRAPV